MSELTNAMNQARNVAEKIGSAGAAAGEKLKAAAEKASETGRQATQAAKEARSEVVSKPSGGADRAEALSKLKQESFEAATPSARTAAQTENASSVERPGARDRSDVSQTAREPVSPSVASKSGLEATKGPAKEAESEVRPEPPAGGADRERALTEPKREAPEATAKPEGRAAAQTESAPRAERLGARDLSDVSETAREPVSPTVASKPGLEVTREPAKAPGSEVVPRSPTGDAEATKHPMKEAEPEVESTPAGDQDNHAPGVSLLDRGVGLEFSDNRVEPPGGRAKVERPEGGADQPAAAKHSEDPVLQERTRQVHVDAQGHRELEPAYETEEAAQRGTDVAVNEAGDRGRLDVDLEASRETNTSG